MLSLSLKQRSRSLTLQKINCLQLRMNRVAKLQFHFDTSLVVIVGFGDRHLEYFIQDVDEDVFDRVNDHVRVSTHPVKFFRTTSVII